MKKENKPTGPITSGIYWYFDEAFRIFTSRVNMFNPHFGQSKNCRWSTYQEILYSAMIILWSRQTIFIICKIKTFVTKTELNNLHFAFLQLKTISFEKVLSAKYHKGMLKKTRANEETLLFICSRNYFSQNISITYIFYWVGSAKKPSLARFASHSILV